MCFVLQCIKMINYGSHLGRYICTHKVRHCLFILCTLRVNFCSFSRNEKQKRSQTYAWLEELSHRNVKCFIQIQTSCKRHQINAFILNLSPNHKSGFLQVLQAHCMRCQQNSGLTIGNRNLQCCSLTCLESLLERAIK